MTALEEFSVLRKYSTNEASFPSGTRKRSPQRGDCGGWKMECQTMFIIEENVEERFSDNDVDTWGSSDH